MGGRQADLVVNNQEAKFILSAYRPNGCDADDPFFAEALRQARQDPMMAEWFACQQAFDRAICSELAQTVPPCNLRDAILAGSKISRASRVGHRRSSSRIWLGLAAGLALIFTLLGTWNSRADAAIDPLPVFASNFVAGGYFLTQHGSSLADLTPWLAGQEAPLPGDLPAGLQELHTLGCRTVNYHGRNLSLICFGQDKQYHLFVARRADFPEMEQMGDVNFLVKSGLTSAAWSDRVNHYVVVSDAVLDDLKICLNCPQS